MQELSVNDLVDLKIVPFNLYNESGDKIMTAGEVITPGKLLQLRYLTVIYRDEPDEEMDLPEVFQSDPPKEQASVEPPPVITETKSIEELIELGVITPDSLAYKMHKEHKQQKQAPAFKLNEKAIVSVKTQNSLKDTFVSAFQSVGEKADTTSVKTFQEVRDIIMTDTLPVFEKVTHKSQLRIIGEYEQFHSLNVSILCAVLAKKMGYSDSKIADLTLAAMLHDIGKARLPEDIFDPVKQTSRNIKLQQLHPQIGYKILKNEMNMPENICKVALEHHEKNDGSGYPYNISGGLISEMSQIVSVCNVYDQLISGRGDTEVRNPKEAVRCILDKGTAWFAPNVLYTFVHMNSYNDITPIEQLNVRQV